MSTLCLAVWISLVPCMLDGEAQPVQEKAGPQAPPAPKLLENKIKASDADQIIRLQKHLDEDSKNLETTKKELSDPNNEYHRADKSFRDTETSLSQKQAELKKLKAKKESTAKLEAEISDLEKRSDLARERFNIAIKAHKIMQDREALLSVKVAKTRKAIELLQGAPAATQSPHSSSQQVPHASAPKTAVQSPGAAAAKGNGPKANVEQLKAQKKAADKEADANKAKEVLKSIDDRLLFLKKNIDLDRRLIAMLHEKAENTAGIHANLKKELEKQRAAKAPQAELTDLTTKLANMDKLSASTAKELREAQTHLKELESHQKKSEADQRIAQSEVERTSQEAQDAEHRLEFLNSPWSPHNIIVWLWTHVPTVAIVILVMVLFQWLVRVASRRIVVWMTHYHFRGTMEDRENRADTLAGVFRNAASFVIFVAGALMILQALGIPIMPLLGGAAAGGLAVAFGAQNLIKDYLSGFMVLVEDQYGINDVIKIAGISGQVENITLRVTSLRDSEGTIHFIPHSTITTVSNMTHRWAQAFVEIHVAYKENVDQVMKVLTDLCKEMRKDPTFISSILGDPEMWGVDQLTEHGVSIQFVLRTAALKQWAVKRELLRRIKNKFDELQIEMPHYDYVYVARSPTSENGKHSMPASNAKGTAQSNA